MGDWVSVKAENLVKHVSGIYYLRAKIAGKVFRRSLSTRKLSIAKLKRDALLITLRIEAGAFRKGAALRRDEALEMTRVWYAALPSYQSKPASLRYRLQLLAVLKETLPDRAVASLSVDEIRAWWASPRVTGFSPSRRNNLLGSLRKFFELAAAAGARPDDPSAGLAKVRVTASAPMLPSKGDFVRIVASVRSMGKAWSEESANFLEFLAFSGCRRFEVVAMQWEDISENFLLVTGGERGTKNSEFRRVPIIPPMAALLERMRYPGASGPVFSIIPKESLKNACARLGLPHLKMHDMRHLFATSCVESGVDWATLAAWLGHKDGGILAAKTYSHLRPDHAVEMAKKVVF